MELKASDPGIILRVTKKHDGVGWVESFMEIRVRPTYPDPTLLRDSELPVIAVDDVDYIF
jgi:hypothetical protein